MPDSTFCSYCSTRKPSTEFVPKKPRQRSPMCKRCDQGRRANRSEAQRDAFGKKITERNYELAQQARRIYHSDL